MVRQLPLSVRTSTAIPCCPMEQRKPLVPCTNRWHRRGPVPTCRRGHRAPDAADHQGQPTGSGSDVWPSRVQSRKCHHSSHVHGTSESFTHWSRQHGGNDMSEQLQQAYNSLMAKAPGAAFQKARSPVSQQISTSPSRQHASRCAFTSAMSSFRNPFSPPTTATRITAWPFSSHDPGQLAVVHWQQPIPLRRSNCAATSKTPGISTRTN